ncbi:MAG TPA: hypothetical protein PLQ35_17420 [bacterium]|nr:hypothetical protein [bacterium]HQL64058.1 hypothetical protein [bacterium]
MKYGETYRNRRLLARESWFKSGCQGVALRYAAALSLGVRQRQLPPFLGVRQRQLPPFLDS